MYSSISFQLTQEEYNYLLPIYRKNMIESSGKYYVSVYNIDDTDDILYRLKGLYDNWCELPAMLIYKCSTNRTIEPFRQYMNKYNNSI